MNLFAVKNETVKRVTLFRPILIITTVNEMKRSLIWLKYNDEKLAYANSVKFRRGSYGPYTGSI